MPEEIICENCGSEVEPDDDFCPECGVLFLENVKCTNHKTVPAEGACVICMHPFCKDCGTHLNNIYFVCSEHSNYEILEGLVCVVEEEDAGRAQRITDYLKSNGLYPYLLSKSIPNHPYTSLDQLNNSSLEEFSELVSGGFKIFVDSQEVLSAEKLIHDYDS